MGYGNLTPKIVEGIESWNLADVYLIIKYVKSVIQYQTGGAIILKYLSLTLMTILGFDIGCFEISQVLCFDIDEIDVYNK